MTTRAEYTPLAWLAPTLITLCVWAIWAFLPKLALQSLPPTSVMFYQSLGSALVSLPIFAYLRFRVKFERRAVVTLACTALLSAVSLFCYFMALRHGPVAVVATLTALYPVICILLARTVLKEHINKQQLAAICMALASVALLTAP